MIATLFYTVDLMLPYYLYYTYITLIFMYLAGRSLPIFHFKWKTRFFLTQVIEPDPSQRDRTIAFLRNLNMVFLLLTSCNKAYGDFD